MSEIVLNCPQCGKELVADEKYIGAMASCSECNCIFVVTPSHYEKMPIVMLFPPQEAAPALILSENLCSFSFANPPDNLAYTKPRTLRFPDKVISVKSWKDVLIECCRYTNERVPQRFAGLLDKKAPFRDTMLASNSAATLRRPQLLSDSIFVETNFSAQSIVLISCGLIAFCGFEPKQFSLEYTSASNIHGMAAVETSVMPIEMSEMKHWLSIVLDKFPTGIELNASAVKLLEQAAGRACPEGVQQQLRQMMFARYDGILLLPEMVATPPVLELVKARAQEYLAQYGCFSLSILFDEFQARLNNLPNPDSDFRLFLLKAILPELPTKGTVFGRLLRQICIPESCTEAKTIELLAERIHGILSDAGDAVLAEELERDLPYLNASAIDFILRENINDAIAIELDGLQYWKLYESFYLPEDFQNTLCAIIREIENDNQTVSLAALTTQVEQLNGDDFRANYAIDDDDVFRQVILVSVGDDDRVWKNNLLVKRSAHNVTNIADEFLQTQTGIFHEDEFFEYAEAHRGLNNKGMLILTFLKNKCIRLDQRRWISLETFERKSNFSPENIAQICRECLSVLGQKDFLPIGNLPSAFFSALSPILIQEQIFYWNGYMLTSVIEHCVPEIQIINSEPSPYTITAMIVPKSAQYSNDVLDYTFRSIKNQGMSFKNCDEVFTFLKTNKIRMTKSKKLLERICTFWDL